jgi:hypothetical protein
MAPPVPRTNRTVIGTRYRELHSYKDAGLKIRNTRFKFFLHPKMFPSWPNGITKRWLKYCAADPGFTVSVLNCVAFTGRAPVMEDPV